MRKTLAIVLLFLSLNALVFGQGTCNLVSNQAPSIRGFHLGMTLNQIYELIPEARTDKNVLEALDRVKQDPLPSKLSLQFQPYNAPYNKLPILQNIEYIGLRLFNNQITDIHVSYRWPNWTNIDEFLAKLRENLLIPETKEWEGSETQKTLRCKDFYMNVSAQNNSGGHISITDTTSPKKMEDLKKEILEKARKEFKP